MLSAVERLRNAGPKVAKLLVGGGNELIARCDQGEDTVLVHMHSRDSLTAFVAIGHAYGLWSLHANGIVNRGRWITLRSWHFWYLPFVIFLVPPIGDTPSVLLNDGNVNFQENRPVACKQPAGKEGRKRRA